MSDVTPPPLHGPSSKEKKYDRQLRLWAANGQAALEEAHVLLVNSGCGVVGVETLKNLVLPGVGNFTIVDPETVNVADLGLNFFLDETSLGDSRAKHCCRFLQELNPDVHGQFISEPIESCLENPDFLKPYTLIVLSSPISASTRHAISSYSQEHRLPLFYTHSLGFFSHISISLPATFPIVETHPEITSAIDLRLPDPWPELSSLAETKTRSLDQLSNHEHGHVPYVLLLLHYIEIWKATHDGKPPRNYTEKSEFRELVRRGARVDEQGGGEENFDEAIGAVLKGLNPSTISSGAREVFEAKECRELTKESADFWIIASAIGSFYEKHSLLPLPGSLPDMKAQSADYIQLQNVYKSKARKDIAEVLTTVRENEKRLGRANMIDEKEVELFCKEAGHIKLIRGRPLRMARRDSRWDDRAQSAYQELQNPDSLLPLYIAFLAYDIYTADSARMSKSSALEGVSTTSAAPGNQEIPLEDPENAELNDEEVLFNHAISILRELWKENDKDFDKEMLEKTDQGEEENEEEAKDLKTRVREFIQEFIRAGGSELHNISAITGGMMAQEIIKVITKQYVPIDNSCLFDGVASKSGVFRL
ncbi:MAG: hypothetical protein M1816_005514 [Peltula sp. TS41687]|nr:MAG: hypothetical protein M1816_005514 [Peltula sp. TS41687]